eukprot:NODE_536_length_7014_cov_0.311208.p2 type:complete len:340 gc:universal NODE_536_length_7014_cov_0.311208:2532-1513(-)
MNHLSLYYFHSAILELFSNNEKETVDKCYSLLLDKGLEQISSPTKKKKSKSRLNLFEDFDLPESQSPSAISTSMKEINNILEPTTKGSAIRTTPVDSKNITIEEFRIAYYKITQLENPDEFMMRFIRARKYHLRKALDMMIRAIKFQIVFQVEKIRMLGDTKLPLHELTGKSFVYNTDEEGRPILYINTALHDKNGASTSEFEEVTIYVIETLRCFVRHPISNIVLVFNLTNFGVQNIDNSLTKFMTACTQDYYPESLYKCFVVNAPWVFNSFWKIIKNWLDPVVQSKVEFCSDEQLRSLLPHLPKILNPESNFEYNYIPPGEADFKFVASRKESEANK